MGCYCKYDGSVWKGCSLCSHNNLISHSFSLLGCLFCWDWLPVYDNESQLHHHWLDFRHQQSQQWSLGTNFLFFRFSFVDLDLCCNVTVFTLNNVDVEVALSFPFENNCHRGVESRKSSHSNDVTLYCTSCSSVTADPGQ